jgi:hypothetical protein
MLEHHTKVLVNRILGMQFTVNYRCHMSPETLEHDPEIRIVAEEAIRELGL